MLCRCTSCRTTSARPGPACCISSTSAWGSPPFRCGTGWRKRYGKHRSLSGATIFVCATNVAIFLLSPGQVWPFYVLFALKGFCFGAFAYLPLAMMADVIDLDTMKTGDARNGSYFAVLGFISKVALSVGGTALVLLALVGYDTAQGAVHGPWSCSGSPFSTPSCPPWPCSAPSPVLDLAADGDAPRQAAAHPGEAQRPLPGARPAGAQRRMTRDRAGETLRVRAAEAADADALAASTTPTSATPSSRSRRRRSAPPRWRAG
jgi:hypothetical protein